MNLKIRSIIAWNGESNFWVVDTIAPIPFLNPSSVDSLLPLPSVSFSLLSLSVCFWSNLNLDAKIERIESNVFLIPPKPSFGFTFSGTSSTSTGFKVSSVIEEPLLTIALGLNIFFWLTPCDILVFLFLTLNLNPLSEILRTLFNSSLKSSSSSLGSSFPASLAIANFFFIISWYVW